MWTFHLILLLLVSHCAHSDLHQESMLVRLEHLGVKPMDVPWSLVWAISDLQRCVFVFLTILWQPNTCVREYHNKMKMRFILTAAYSLYSEKKLLSMHLEPIIAAQFVILLNVIYLFLTFLLYKLERNCLWQWKWNTTLIAKHINEKILLYIPKMKVLNNLTFSNNTGLLLVL